METHDLVRLLRLELQYRHYAVNTVREYTRLADLFFDEHPDGATALARENAARWIGEGEAPCFGAGTPIATFSRGVVVASATPEDQGCCLCGTLYKNTTPRIVETFPCRPTCSGEAQHTKVVWKVQTRTKPREDQAVAKR